MKNAYRNQQKGTSQFKPAPESMIPASVVQEAFKQGQPINDFVTAQQEVKVEHLSVTGFLRTIPHKWHLEDIHRFGNTVGKTADAVQCAYITMTDMALGVVRVFPRPLLARVYEILAPQQNWPAPEGQLALDDPRRPLQEKVRTHAKLAKHLRTLSESTKSEEVQQSIKVVLRTIEEESVRISQEIEAGAPAASPMVAEQAAS